LTYLSVSNFFNSCETFLEFIKPKARSASKNKTTPISVKPISNSPFLLKFWEKIASLMPFYLPLKKDEMLKNGKYLMVILE
jgi:hypothetical protein